MFLYIDPSKCTGCMLCEAFCSFKKEGAIWPSKSRITVLKWEEKAAFIPFTCLQCERPLCAEACPVGAISRDSKTGAMVVNEKRCLGCKTCVLACPFGGINFDEEKGYVVKCDLCGGDPECAKQCPKGAISFVHPDRMAPKKKREAAAKITSLLEVVAPVKKEEGEVA